MNPPKTDHRKKPAKSSLSLFIFPLLSLLLVLFVDLDPTNPNITRTAAIALLMAGWWITEAIPLAVTALLPVVLFPLLGIMDGKVISSQYTNHIIFIFIGGFIMALAMERWDLHRRIALKVLLLFGIYPRRILLGFMAATWFLSMWISNTATAMMMVPIALAIVTRLEGTCGLRKVKRFSLGLFLGIAYSASMGGVATLIGTPPNLSFARIFHIFYPSAPHISFSRWFLFGFPVSLVMLLICWGLLVLLFCRDRGIEIDPSIIQEQYRSLGPLSREEKIVLVHFSALVILWMTRSGIQLGSFSLPGWGSLFPHARFINDGTVAILIAVLLFLIPDRTGKKRIMDWPTAVKLPWGIVLLFGGGFALATGFKTSGLSAWMGSHLKGLSEWPPLLIILIICFSITFLTELTSNTATAEVLLPILAAMALAMKMHPLLFMVPGTLSCSFAFMLPVATPPNAIVFGTRRVCSSEMAKTGLFLNFTGILVVTLAIFLLGKVIFGIDLTQPPAWLHG